MAKVHDKFVIELAEVIKGYGNDPDVDDPFRLSEFYRFYELPEIAVSANHFKTMIPLEVVEKNAQPGWIPVMERLPKPNEEDGNGFHKAYLVQDGRWMDVARWDGKYWVAWGYSTVLLNVVAWCELPTPYREGGQDNA